MNPYISCKIRLTIGLVFLFSIWWTFLLSIYYILSVRNVINVEIIWQVRYLFWLIELGRTCFFSEFLNNFVRWKRKDCLQLYGNANIRQNDFIFRFFTCELIGFDRYFFAEIFSLHIIQILLSSQQTILNTFRGN